MDHLGCLARTKVSGLDPGILDDVDSAAFPIFFSSGLTDSFRQEQAFMKRDGRPVLLGRC